MLRRILRRAARHGRLLNLKEPFLYKLAGTVAGNMSDAFPELKTNLEQVSSIIKAEEERFGETLDQGLELFDRVAEKVVSAKSKVIPGEEAFKLYDTYGFPLDLTQVMARERGLTVDIDGFERELTKQQEKSKEDRKLKHVEFSFGIPIEYSKATHFKGYEELKVESKIEEIRQSEDPNYKSVILTSTSFYGESGGQVGDTGKLYRPADPDKGIEGFVFKVEDTQKVGNTYFHIGKIESGNIDDLKDKEIIAEVDIERRKRIQRNHTVTHLLHKALREVLGEHVHQAGSYVAPDRMRFDFTHFKAVEQSELQLIEQKVNQAIIANLPVRWSVTDFDTAKSKGAMALFGEKYGDDVRLVEIGDGFSRELCGGTHVQSTGEIGLFVVVSESAIASGMRRIEAVTGDVALDYLRRKKEEAEAAAQLLKVPTDKLVERVINLTASEKRLARELAEIKKQQEKESVKGKLGQGEQVGEVMLLIDSVSGRDAALTYTDQIKKAEQPTLVGLLNKSNYFLAASPSAIKIGIDAQKAIKFVNNKFEGRGGGKSHFAQGGCKAEITIDQFKQCLREFIPQVSGGQT